MGGKPRKKVYTARGYLPRDESVLQTVKEAGLYPNPAERLPCLVSVGAGVPDDVVPVAVTVTIEIEEVEDER